MTLQIKKATKSASKLRLALIGASGSGKTFTALAIAENLGQKILFVDTEHGSASKYADIFNFDVVELDDFSPDKFIEVIELVNRIPEPERYDVLIIDSLSHAWMGKNGILEQHGNAEARTKNSFTAWKDVTPKHNALIEAIVQSKLHLIATMRAKTEYSMKKDDKTNRTSVQTVGLAPVQRDGMEYEFDVVAHLDEDNNFIVKKTRCSTLSEKVFPKAGAAVAEILKVWLEGVKTTIVKNTLYRDSPPLAPDARGKLLFEAGDVARTATGYSVGDNGDNGDNIENKKIVFDIVKQNNIVICNCDDYADGTSDVENYQCAHIWAVRFYAQSQVIERQAA